LPTNFEEENRHSASHVFGFKFGDGFPTIVAHGLENVFVLDVTKETDPILWDLLSSGGSSQFFYREGLFSVKDLHPADMDDYVWHLVSFIPKEHLYANLNNLLLILFMANIAIAFITGVSFLFLYKAMRRRLLAEKRVMQLNDVLQIISKILQHDLANNFQSIKGLIDLAGTAEKECRKLMERITGKADRGIKLIIQMRNLEAALSSEHDTKKIELNKLIRQIMNGRDIQFHAAGDASVYADEALKVVIDNIVDNAVHHGKAKKINFTIRKVQRGLEIRIANDGTNIPKKIHDRVFDEGFTSGTAGNTGLGMFIAKKTAERYGGRIYIKDNKPHGAVFVIWLPDARVA